MQERSCKVAARNAGSRENPSSFFTAIFADEKATTCHYGLSATSVTSLLKKNHILRLQCTLPWFCHSHSYLFCCSYTHNVAAKGKYIAFVTTEAETDDPQKELKPGIDLLGPVDEIFFDTYDRYEPANQSSEDNCFISTSYDAITHFETTVQDVITMYSKITGKTLDLSVDLSAASAADEE